MRGDVMEKKNGKLSYLTILLVVLFLLQGCNNHSKEVDGSTCEKYIAKIEEKVYGEDDDVTATTEASNISSMDENPGPVLVEIHSDGSMEEVVEGKTLSESLQAEIRNRTTISVQSVSDDTCEVLIKSPDFRMIYCKALKIDEDTLLMLDDSPVMYDEVLTEMIRIVKEETPWKETALVLPIKDGEPVATEELFDAMWGGMLSFQEEYYEAVLGG